MNINLSGKNNQKVYYVRNIKQSMENIIVEKNLIWIFEYYIIV